MPPYVSDAQRRYFNANKAELESKGVNVQEWNDASRGMNLPERKTTRQVRQHSFMKRVNKK